ncbi:adenylyltransferase/cytidyltransferase family protein [Actinomyces sp. MRS3W]|uniref:adenylyltransferase/cytidyltransferase family protein n=1 Tax=Actinomyces sp. MRS3W TaxID=2800796 RepID=UPI0028FCFDF7|nr:adenylyltransferase/cytidyltransferase family protein [Actinomyces sp. MRS3W]MDU0348258.1 adenylyltransferase/cytidyltransferase family protein [Actinomyces sp. MRS3W]
MITGYLPGGFDMLHVGHLNLLTAAATRCDRLIVGIATDESLRHATGHAPIVPQEERMALVAALRVVDAVVPDFDPDKRVAWQRDPFDILFADDELRGTKAGNLLEEQMAEVGASVVYLPSAATTASPVLRRLLAQHPDPSADSPA